MLDIKFIKNNAELVKENMKKKFQEEKIHLVDEVVLIYDEYCEIKRDSDSIRAQINKISKEMATLIKTDAKKAQELKIRFCF